MGNSGGRRSCVTSSPINPDGGFEAGTRIDGDVLLADLEGASGSGFKQVLIGPDGKLYKAR